MGCIRLHTPLTNEKGVTIVLVAILMVVLVMFVAIAVDLGHLYVARNELQNAADAGALAGARMLYIDGNATLVNEGANQTAYDAAIANLSEGVAVEVNWNGGNEGDVQRGHWSFANGGVFTSNASLAVVDLWGVSTAELDANTDFINAVQVTVRRQNTPVTSFFAGIFGLDRFIMSAQAVAYLGFAGSLLPGDVDQPIAICEESIINPDNEYDCNIGRFINSGQNVQNNETGGWTSLEQDMACTGGTNSQEMRSLICSNSALPAVELGEPIATNGGQIQSAFDDLYDCWRAASGKTSPWNLTLPVVACPGNNITTCQTLVGAVNLNVIWMFDNTFNPNNPNPNDMPTEMSVSQEGQTTSWSSAEAGSGATPQQIWDSFASRFNLRNVDGSPAPMQQKAIYFLPDCNPHDPAGLTGGRNFGILAEIPVLVD